MAEAPVRLCTIGALIVVFLFFIGALISVGFFFCVFGIQSFRRNETVSMRELLSVSIVLAERGGEKLKEIADVHSVPAKTREEAMGVLTQGDWESHRAIVNGFLKAYPGLTVISEEHENKPVDFNQVPDVDKQLLEVVSSVSNDQQIPINNIAVWVDSLDAAQEYTEGLFKYVTTMVCVVVNGEPTIGVIYKPFTKETVWAWADYGHSSNLKKASEMTKDEKERKIVVSRSHAGPVEMVAKKAFGENTEVIPAGGAGFKTLEVLRGNVEAYVHVTYIKKWDICAGHAILKAVGGMMTTLEGNYITYYPTDSPKNEDGVLATTVNHHDYLKKLTPEMVTLNRRHRLGRTL